MNNEDIKVLENFIRVYKELNEKSTDFYFNKAEIPIEIIENLIKGYKELEELLEEKTIRVGFENKEDYIPKSKVREKIEKLLEHKENINERFDKAFYNLTDIIEFKIKVLEELLQEGDDK